MQGQREAPTHPSILARAAAAVLDCAIALVLAGFVGSGVAEQDATRVAIILGVFSLYEIGFHLVIGATPGKMALRMHVAGPGSQRPEPDRVILRYLVFLVSLLSVAGLVVSGVMALLDPQRRALHDRVAATRVLYGRPGWLQDGT